MQTTLMLVRMRLLLSIAPLWKPKTCQAKHKACPKEASAKGTNIKETQAKSGWKNHKKANSNAYLKISIAKVEGSTSDESVWHLRFLSRLQRRRSDNRCQKANNAEVFCITLAPAPTPLARIEYSVEKRDQCTFKPKEVPAFTITSLNYPSNLELYRNKDGASLVKKHALKFASDDVTNTEVVYTKKKPTAKEIDGYVTEHIVEVGSALSKR
jgi:hypothetical protein